MKMRWMKKTAALLLALMMLGSGTAFAAEEVVSQKLSNYYSLAVGYIARNDYDKAMQFLDAALLICPEETNGDMYADLLPDETEYVVKGTCAECAKKHK